MKDRIKTLLIGILIGAIMVPTAYATVGTVSKELFYNDIKITLDGSELTPTDADGNYAEPFIIDGTTYLPVRGVANALGLGVEWDSASNTVKLSSDKGTDAPIADNVTKVGDVIFEEDGIILTLSEIDEGKNLNTYYFTLENTTDYEVVFFGENFSVNDFMINEQLQYRSVLPGKKAQSSIMAWKGDLSSHKSDYIETIEFTLRYSVNKTPAEEKLITLNF